MFNVTLQYLYCKILYLLSHFIFGKLSIFKNPFNLFVTSYSTYVNYIMEKKERMQSIKKSTSCHPDWMYIENCNDTTADFNLDHLCSVSEACISQGSAKSKTKINKYNIQDYKQMKTPYLSSLGPDLLSPDVREKVKKKCC